MARDKNTFEKHRREMEKRRKAEEKRKRRRLKKEQVDEPEQPDVDSAPIDEIDPAASPEGNVPG